ncbi:hypothetical protein ASF17_14155 [Frigoribacterium sp. Leaf263]|nr:hypothetical protein ASF17_14155 [Frigoribacterium sp. Leaf263]
MNGDVVVDIFGGEARPGKNWTAHTKSVVFSVSKGVTTILLLMAAESGFLDLDRPVAEYWPEFGAHGKGSLTVRELLAHRGGIIGLEQPVAPHELGAWFPVVDALATQKPLWRPGTGHEYHAITLGYLAGEVLRRTTGCLPSEWLAAEVAAPLGLDMTYGDDIDDPNRALIRQPMDQGAGIPMSPFDDETSAQILFSHVYGPGDIFEVSNKPVFLDHESPAANLVTRARDLARLYSATVVTTDGVRLLQASTVAEASAPLSIGKPLLGPDVGTRWGTGFMIHSHRRPMAGPGSFGHDGAGGQLAFAHPGLELGFGFQTAFPGGDFDDRANRLTTALQTCL